MELNQVLEEILASKVTHDLSGNRRMIDDGVSRKEAYSLYRMVKDSKARTTLEVGFAHGVSGLAFCQAINENGEGDCLHYAVDPNQLNHYNSAGICAIERAGYLKYLHLLDGPSHLKLPELIQSGVKLDCAFIDGWHTFDYTLIDFFLIDKILKPGGYIAFHDVYGRAKQKVIKFILTHRKYEIDTKFMLLDGDPWKYTIKFFIWRILKDPMLLFSWYHWRFQLRSSSGLLILKKIDNFEPNYDFFKNF